MLQYPVYKISGYVNYIITGIFTRRLVYLFVSTTVSGIYDLSTYFIRTMQGGNTGFCSFASINSRQISWFEKHELIHYLMHCSLRSLHINNVNTLIGFAKIMLLIWRIFSRRITGVVIIQTIYSRIQTLFERTFVY